MEVVLQGTINSLGYLEDGKYHQEPDCYESIRDLIRFLRNDNGMQRARRICSERNIVENDLIPILKTPKITKEMFDICLRLMANLCQPTIVSMQGKQPEDKEQWQAYWELEQNLLRSKLAFADVELFAVLKTHLEEFFLETVWEERTEEDKMVVERIMILLRYVLSINSGEKSFANLAHESSHDKVIEAFLDSGVSEVLLHIASTLKERDFHLSVLEIVALVLREHKPSELLEAEKGRTAEDAKIAELELRKIFESEQQKANATRRKAMGTRHSRFAGSYVVKGLQAVNKENDLIVTKAISDPSKVDFMDSRKVKRRGLARNRLFEGSSQRRVASVSVRLKLKKFVEKLLESAYDRLVKNCKESAFGSRRSISQRNSDINFMIIVRFCVEYVRLAGMSSDKVSCTLGKEIFHFMQVQIDSALENAQTDKQRAKFFGLRAQYSLQAYKELILLHQHMLDNGTEDEKDFAQSTCEYILKVEEYRDLGISLLRKFTPSCLSKTFLRDLILTTHHYLRLIEKSAKNGTLTKVVKKTKKAKRSKKNEKKRMKDGKVDTRTLEKEENKSIDNLMGEELSVKWENNREELEKVVKGEIEFNHDATPINSLLEVDDTDHQSFLMLRIQRCLRKGDHCEAIGLYRGGRELWPEGDMFGRNGMDTEEEMSELKAIYEAEMTTEAAAYDNVLDKLDGGFVSEREEEEEEYNSEDEEEERRYELKEVNFDFSEYVVKFARADVLRWYIVLLCDFRSNTVELNKALVKMMHRVAFDLKEPSRLFQLSLFRVFLQIKEYFDGLTKEEKKQSPFLDVYTFGFHLLKRFWSCYESIGCKLAAECLFWKNAQECYEIENGYGSYEQNKKESHQTWTEELEDEVKSLHSEYLAMEERPEGMDILDFIEHNMPRARTRKQIGRKLKEFGLDVQGAKMTKPSAGSFPLIPAKELIEEFNNLDEDDRGDLVDFLRDGLEKKYKEFSRAKIIKELTYLGVTYEKKKKPRDQIDLKILREYTDAYYDQTTEDRGASPDLVDFIRDKLLVSDRPYPRKTIITSLLSMGITYSKPLKKPWSEGLLLELGSLNEQHNEMEEEEKEKVSITDYVMRRLSEKKPRGQVEHQLREMGVNVPMNERVQRKERGETVREQKKKKKAVERDEFVASDDEEEVDEENSGESGSEGEDTDNERDEGEESDEEERRDGEKQKRKEGEEREETVVEQDMEGDGDDSLQLVMGEEDEEKEEESVQREEREEKSVMPKKRRLVVDSDDDESPIHSPLSHSPSPVNTLSPQRESSPSQTTKKRARVVIEDSDEE